MSMAVRPRAVGVFCGSRTGRKEAYAEAAFEVGRALARAGIRIVYGGGGVGLMGVVADAALAAGGEVVGFIPERLIAREGPRNALTRLEVTPTMFARKQQMIAQSDAFLVLPGGFGTLDELLEVITLRQLGYHDRPIVLLNVDGYFDRLLAFFEEIVEEDFADPSTLSLWAVARDVGEALELLAGRTPASSAAE